MDVRTSSRCNWGNCVGVRLIDDGVEIFDTKDLSLPALAVQMDDWVHFIGDVKAGLYDELPGVEDSANALGSITSVEVRHPAGDTVLLSSRKQSAHPGNSYTWSEWHDFTAGVHDDEFDIVMVDATYRFNQPRRKAPSRAGAL